MINIYLFLLINLLIQTSSSSSSSTSSLLLLSTQLPSPTTTTTTPTPILPPTLTLFVNSNSPIKYNNSKCGNIDNNEPPCIKLGDAGDRARSFLLNNFTSSTQLIIQLTNPFYNITNNDSTSVLGNLFGFSSIYINNYINNTNNNNNNIIINSENNNINLPFLTIKQTNQYQLKYMDIRISNFTFTQFNNNTTIFDIQTNASTLSLFHIYNSNFYQINGVIVNSISINNNTANNNNNNSNNNKLTLNSIIIVSCTFNNTNPTLLPTFKIINSKLQILTSTIKNSKFSNNSFISIENGGIRMFSSTIKYNDFYDTTSNNNFNNNNNNNKVDTINPGNPNQRNKQGQTPLHLSTHYRIGYEFTRIILKKKGNVFLKDNFGQTCFHLAVERCHSTMVLNLLRLYPNLVFKQNNHGLYPVHFAAMDDTVDIIDIFIDHQIQLLERDKNAPLFILFQDSVGMTPLHWAASLGLTSICQKLVQFGGCNIRDFEGETAIFKAIRSANPTTFQYFLSLPEVDTSIINFNGMGIESLLKFRNVKKIQPEICQF